MRTARPTTRRAAALLLPALLPALLLVGCATGTDPIDPGGDDGSGTDGGATDGGTTVDPDEPVTDDGSATEQPSTPPPSPTGLPADLTVSLDKTGEGDVTTWSLTCGPPGGDHPDPTAACGALEAAGGAAAFDPVPRNVACTEIWGGPQTARVEGTVDGVLINADFSRANGCEIARWEALIPLLGSAGGA